MLQFRPMSISLMAALIVGLFTLSARAEEGATALLDRINLPPGFEIQVFAEVPGAREMAVADALKTVFVGTGHDKVYAVLDRDGDGRGEEVVEIATDLNRPSGVAFKDGYLFVAAQDRILRYVVEAIGAGQRYRALILKMGLPESHPLGERYAAIGGDNKLYVTLGASCNVCEVSGLQGTILRMNLDGSESEVFAYGVRSAGGIDFQPKDDEVPVSTAFFTDSGVEGLGEMSPPNEVNHAWQAGLHFGFPWFAGGGVKAPGYEEKTPPADVQWPVVRLVPHGGVQGIHFYRGRMFPREYRGGLFVAEQGSADSALPVGYRVLLIRFDDGRPIGVDVFATGWLREEGPLGGPVDIDELGDGSLLISDEQAGLIYRVFYTGS